MPQKTTDPGYQYVIADQQTIIARATEGLADVRNTSAMTRDHMLPVYSMTKTFTAIALLQLADRGIIRLEDSINHWLDTPYPDQVTIGHLLTHTSGIANPIPLKWVHLPDEHGSFDENAFLKKLTEKYSRLTAAPGHRYRYSNIGYWLAGKIVEAASGLSFTDYVSQHIFAPVGVTSAMASFTIAENAMATGYVSRWSVTGLLAPWLIDARFLGTSSGKWREIVTPYMNGPAYGGIYATTDGIILLLRDLLRDDSLLLSPDARKLLFTQARTNDGKPVAMSYGWHIAESGGQVYYFKEGGGAGFHSEMRIYPDSGVASVLMANRTAFNVKEVLSTLDALTLKTRTNK